MKQEVGKCEVPLKIRFDFNSDGGDLVSDWCSECRPSCSISSCSNSSTSPCPLGWPIRNASCSTSNSNEEHENRRFDAHSKGGSNDSDIHEIKLMKERFSKLLLGEDMSGSGKGVCTALAISNAITNLYATVFGQLWRLEPLSTEKKSAWLREMDWLLCVGDYIVELMPSWQTLSDGKKVEVMICRPRSDLFVNLPALHKLDNMLIEILDGFRYTEFWYIDQGVINIDGDRDRSVSCKKFMKRHKEKWWLPVPRISPGGLCERTRKELIHNRECANQILKAVQNINSTTLEDMEIPESYIQTLPKSGRTCLGEAIYRYITSSHFSPDCLLDCLNLSSEHSVLDAANCIEASIHLWTRKTHPKHTNILGRSTSKTSWEMVKDLVVERDKMGLLLQRAKSLLFCLKKRFPCLPQTSLDTSKIHFNKDVGRSILESYSRVLEGLAFNIIARIEDVLFVDDLTKRSSGRVSPVIGVASGIAWRKEKSPCGAVKTTPYKATNSARSSRSLSVLGVSPGGGEGSPFLGKNTQQHPRGFMVKRVLSSYLGEGRNKSCGREG